jgi:hypothetical protein
MRILQLIIGMIVVGIAWSVLSRPASKIPDRIEPVEAFCDAYYLWRSTQAGGVSAVDRICFDAQTMKP